MGGGGERGGEGVGEGKSAGGEAEHELCGLERHVELRAVPDAVELDPVGLRQPVRAVARGARGQRQDPVGAAPHDPHGARDLLGLDAPAVAQRERDQVIDGVTAGRAADLVGEQLGRDVLEVGGDVLRRATPAPGRGEDRFGVGRGEPQRLLQRGEVRERVLVGVIARAQPPAGASATTLCARPREASCSDT